VSDLAFFWGSAVAIVAATCVALYLLGKVVPK
jgi:hypothetical protein